MIARLEEEFGTCPERNNGRITSLVRWFAAEPRYEGLFDGKRENEADEWDMLMADLPSVLREQSGSTIEERWNTLMDELGYQEMVEGGVYLKHWKQYDRGTYDPDVSREWDGSW